MPVTLTFTLGNVDLHRLLAYKPGKLAGPKKAETSRATGDVDQAYKKNPGNQTADDTPFYAIMAEARAQGYATATWYAFTGTTIPGVVTVNNGGLVDVGNIDGTSSADLTTAERVGVQIATDFVRIARRWRIPGLQHCHLQRAGGVAAAPAARAGVATREVDVAEAQRILAAWGVLPPLDQEEELPPQG
jgi:hypothetical protein